MSTGKAREHAGCAARTISRVPGDTDQAVHRSVRPAYPTPAIPIPVSYAACHTAWLKARRGKRPSANQLAFDACWLDRLLALKTALRAGAWQPARTVSFIVNHPKTREIHAPDFADRVVHHLLVDRLDRFYEPVFIHDSYANRAGKGSHAAVDRLQAFMRQMNGRGWFLQLDIHNYFNSIHRPTLYGLLKRRIGKAGRHGEVRCAARSIELDSGDVVCTVNQSVHTAHSTVCGVAAGGIACDNRSQRGPDGVARNPGTATAEAVSSLPPGHALALQSLCHKLLIHPVRERVSDPAAAARIPQHKRLANAAPGCGLPVGNLTSQFFANVYLNELDQFIKHRLKCRRYLRYVDDFVLLADTREQLLDWQAQIETFLAATLRLKLKDDVRLGPLSQGVDFLGYLVFPSHRLVRPRVLRHCRAKIETWARRHVHATAQGVRIRADAPDMEALQAMLGSYWGHSKHANSARLRRALFARFPWLEALFMLDAAASGRWAATVARAVTLTPRWVLQGATFQQQSDVFVQAWPQVWRLLQRGNRWMAMPASGRPRELTEAHAIAVQTDLRRRGVAYVRAAQTGWLKHGTRRREIVEWFIPAP